MGRVTGVDDAENRCACRRPFGDPIVFHLEPAALIRVVAKEHLMQLKDDTDRERHRGMRFVDQRQRVAIAGDLLLRSVARLRRPEE